MNRSLGIAAAVAAFVLLAITGVALAADWDALAPSMTLDEPTAEELIHEQVNEAREQRGLAALALDDELEPVARDHSAEMAERSFFDHTNPDGVDPAERIARAGVDCAVASENIARLARSNHEAPLAEETVDAWLDSPGHLMNMLDDDWERTAIGVVADEEAVYVTQKFCR